MKNTSEYPEKKIYRGHLEENLYHTLMNHCNGEKKDVKDLFEKFPEIIPILINILEHSKKPKDITEIETTTIISKISEKIFAAFGIITTSSLIIASIISIQIEAAIQSKQSSIIEKLKILFSHNPIFTQKRITKGGKEFSIYKLKTMENNEVTNVGEILRKLSFDEFLQFLNVLKGDIRIMGARPIHQDEINNIANDKLKAFYTQEKAGISGLSQVLLGQKAEDFVNVKALLHAFEERYASSYLLMYILLKSIPGQRKKGEY